MLPRWEDGVEREALIRPVGEQINQLSLPQQSRHHIFHHLHDSIACQAETVHGDDVADDDTTICGNLYDSSATMELPFERTAGLRVAIIYQDMSVGHEILRRGRMLVPFEVRGRSDGHNARVPELSHNQARNRRVSDMDRNVKALAYQHTEVIPRYQLRVEFPGG